MEILKFQAWHPELGRMFHDVSVNSEWWLSKCQHFGGNIANIRQFVCAKDIHGVEIYRGDILKHHKEISYSRNNGIIAVDIYAVVVSGCHGYTVKQIGKEPLRALSFEEYEIIGNIFENPNLLTELYGM